MTIAVYRGRKKTTEQHKLLNIGQLSKERICSSRSKLFLLRVDPILEGFHPLEKHIESHKSCFPFLQKQKNMKLYPYTLEVFTGNTMAYALVIHVYR